jgi:hypothetical protein
MAIYAINISNTLSCLAFGAKNMARVVYFLVFIVPILLTNVGEFMHDPNHFFQLLIASFNLTTILISLP